MQEIREERTWERSKTAINSLCVAMLSSGMSLVFLQEQSLSLVSLHLRRTPLFALLVQQEIPETKQSLREIFIPSKSGCFC